MKLVKFLALSPAGLAEIAKINKKFCQHAITFHSCLTIASSLLQLLNSKLLKFDIETPSSSLKDTHIHPQSGR